MDGDIAAGILIGALILVAINSSLWLHAYKERSRRIEAAIMALGELYGHR